jgi:hypothetical protein
MFLKIASLKREGRSGTSASMIAFTRPPPKREDGMRLTLLLYSLPLLLLFRRRSTH